MRASDRVGRRARPVSPRMGAFLLLALLIVLLLNRERLLQQARYFNRRFTNPLALRFAGRRGAYYAVVAHTGRQSGKSYQTPVGATAVKDGFVIPLPYGTKVDWLLNIEAAGGAGLRWNGQDYALIEPTRMDAAAARKLLPSAAWWAYRLVGITQFVRVGCLPPQSGEALEEAPRAESPLPEDTQGK